MSPPEATDPATRSRAGEDTALLATPQDEAPQSKAAQMGVILAACLAYICLSSCLINYNKFLMHSDYFPYSMALTALHMFISTTMCSIVYLIGGQKWLPGMAVVKASPDGYMKKLIPLSIFFAASICLSNEAYIYCSVPFLQMCKELNVVMVYFVGLALAVERFNVQTTTVLFIIMCGCCMSIHGEMRFSLTGFLIQLSGQSAEVLKIIMQQKIMQGLKIDPLTMVLTMSPLCLATLGVGLFIFWQPGILVAAQAHWVHLLLNGLNAFALNVAVAVVIRVASGVSFVLAGVVKDVAIVGTAALMFNAHISVLQMAGFTVAVLGVFMHSILRIHEDFAAEHGVFKTFGSVLFGFRLEKESKA